MLDTSSIEKIIPSACQSIKASRVTPEVYYASLSDEQKQILLRELRKTNKFVTIVKNDEGDYETSSGELQRYNFSGRALPSEGVEPIMFSDVYNSEGDVCTVRASFVSENEFGIAIQYDDGSFGPEVVFKAELTDDSLYLVQYGNFAQEFNAFYQSWLDENLPVFERFRRIRSPRAAAEFFVANYESLIQCSIASLGFFDDSFVVHKPYFLHQVIECMDDAALIGDLLNVLYNIVGQNIYVDLLLMRDDSGQSVVDLIHKKDGVTAREAFRKASRDYLLSIELLHVPQRLSERGELDTHASSINSCVDVSTLKLLTRFTSEISEGERLFTIDTPRICRLDANKKFRKSIKGEVKWLSLKVDELIAAPDSVLLSLGTAPLNASELSQLKLNLIFAKRMFNYIENNEEFSGPHSSYAVSIREELKCGLNMIQLFGLVCYALRTGKGMIIPNDVPKKKVLENYLIKALQGIKNIVREYNDSDDLRDPDKGKCIAGTANELINILAGIHQDVSILSVNQSDFIRDAAETIRQVILERYSDAETRGLSLDLAKELLIYGTFSPEHSAFMKSNVEAALETRYGNGYLYPAEDFYRAPAIFDKAVSSVQIPQDIAAALKQHLSETLTLEELHLILDKNQFLRNRIMILDGERQVPFLLFVKEIKPELYDQLMDAFKDLPKEKKQQYIQYFTGTSQELEVLNDYIEADERAELNAYRDVVHDVIQKAPVVTIWKLMLGYPKLAIEILNAFIMLEDDFLVYRMISKLPSMNDHEASLVSPLIVAMQKNRVDYCKLLIERGVDINRKHEFGFAAIHQTPLHEYSIFEFLAQVPNIDFSAKNRNVETVLEHAIKENREDIVKGIIKYAPKLFYQDNKYEIVRLFHILSKNLPKINDIILQSSLNLNFQNRKKETALHFLITNDFVEAACLLIRKPSVDINLLDVNGRSPLYLAILLKRASVVDALLDRSDLAYHAKEFNALQAPNKRGILMRMVANPKFEVNIEGECGQTLIDIAINTKDLELLDGLVARPDVGIRMDLINGAKICDFVVSESVPNEAIRKLFSHPGFRIGIIKDSINPYIFALKRRLNDKVEALLDCFPIIVTPEFMSSAFEANCLPLWEKLLSQDPSCTVDKSFLARVMNPTNLDLLNIVLRNLASVADISLVMDAAIIAMNKEVMSGILSYCQTNGLELEVTALNRVLGACYPYESEATICKIIELGADNILTHSLNVVDVLVDKGMFKAAKLLCKKGLEISRELYITPIGKSFMKYYADLEDSAAEVDKEDLPLTAATGGAARCSLSASVAGTAATGGGVRSSLSASVAGTAATGGGVRSSLSASVAGTAATGGGARSSLSASVAGTAATGGGARSSLSSSVAGTAATGEGARCLLSLDANVVVSSPVRSRKRGTDDGMSLVSRVLDPLDDRGLVSVDLHGLESITREDLDRAVSVEFSDDFFERMPNLDEIFAPTKRARGD